MDLLSKDDIVNALTRLGALAKTQGIEIELIAVGGAVMVLSYNARLATHDVDAVIVSPVEARIARELAQQVAKELNWSEEWLNDGAKGYLIGKSQGPIVFQSSGIVVRRPAVEQLLAMKLSAWRDDVDIEDARRLLQEMDGTKATIWSQIEGYLIPGRELKAEYAFLDLWETRNDTD